jgi:DNA-binding CsgD family transcriptional regulator
MRAFVDAQMARAYGGDESADLAEVVQFIAYLLEGEGRLQDAIAEIDHALSTKLPPHSRGHLHALRAAMLATTGARSEAMQSITASEELIEQEQPREFSKWLVLTETSRMQLLEPPSERLTMLLAATPPKDARLDQVHLLCSYVPYLAATGERRMARPLIRQVKAQVQAEPHVWRGEEVAGFEAWVAVARSVTEELPSARVNPHAGRRLASMRLFAATLRRDLAEARAARADIAGFVARLPDVDIGPAAAWDAWLDVPLGLPASAFNLQPPKDATTFNIGAHLAAANAIALTGSEQEARVWLTWVKSLGRKGIESSLEWPVSRSRIEALLELRLGNLQSARAAMHRARSRTLEAGYEIEAAIAEVQVRQLVPDTAADDADSQGRAAHEVLLQMGVDPLPHVFAAKAGPGVRSARRPELTARETQVLKLLSEGKTYKGVAAALEIKWPTVQTTAHRIYEKLGVSGRHEAVKAAV